MTEIAALRRFGPAGVIAFAVILLSGNIVLPDMMVIPAGAILVLLWVEISGTPWSEIGYVRPNALHVALAVAGGIALKILLKYGVMPLLGAPRVNATYHFLAGNSAILPTAILGLCIVGFAEETVFRGFLFERLETIFGDSAAARTSIVIITSIVFALAHFADQGLPGVEQALITGTAFGTMFALRRSIVPVMAAHAAFDLTALAIIYLRLE